MGSSYSSNAKLVAQTQNRCLGTQAFGQILLWVHEYCMRAMLRLVLVFVVFCFSLVVGDTKSESFRKDLKAVESLVPLKDGNHVFFWRPQKVGSSTMLSILMSYSFRYNFLPKRKSSSNAYCRRFAKCAIVNKQYGGNVTYSALETYVKQRVPGSPDNDQRIKKKDLDIEKLSSSLPFRVSLSHEICNLDSALIATTMACSFLPEPNSHSPATKIPIVKELFMLRDPVSRAISAYYFWGELYKMKHAQKYSRSGKAKLAEKTRSRSEKNEDAERRQLGMPQLGKTQAMSPLVVGGSQLFRYHGDETTAPDPFLAMQYANNTVFKRGMPGPSYTWSAFANNIEDAVRVVNSDRICTVVLERLPESLVVASHVLGWSLADMVVVKHRKALSSHPKAEEWPAEAVQMLRRQLNAPNIGEYRLYNASVAKLDQRIQVLKMIGVDIEGEMNTLKVLQRRASEVRCRPF